jgi:hypothetical protein
MPVLNREKCDDGYTLYWSRNTERAQLIDIDSREVHRWDFPQGGSWHYAEMQPNGNLIVIIKEFEGKFPGLLFELDWDSRLVWKADVAAHHDFDRLANGNTLVVCREYVENPVIREGRIKSDSILELDPDAQIVWEWHADQAIHEIADRVHIDLPCPEYDWAHTNTVESLPATPAGERDERFREGNVLFSCRHIDTIGVIDKDTRKVVWAWGPGQVDKQHHPTMLPDGHILIYDNGCAAVRSRIVELDPLTEQVVWTYEAHYPDSFYSYTQGSSDRLPNGNTFIAESNSGRLFEVTPEGEMVWEFLTPDFLPGGSRMTLYRALRYPKAMVEELLASKKESAS